MILDEVPDGIYITNREQVVVHWSRGAEKVFGYAPEEAIGSRLHQLIGVEGLRADDTTLRRRKDGALIHVETVSRSVGTDQDYELVSARDVTRQKSLRDARLVESRFLSVLESTPDAIIMANSAGRIVLANSQAERLFGYGHGELRGQVIEELLPQRLRDTHVGHRAGFFAQPRTRTMGAGLELNGVRKDGTEFPLEISLSPIQTDEGRLVMSAIRDISDRKRIERTLSEQKQALEQANQAKDRFLASMSHELRTPLNAILGFAQLLSSKTLPITPEQRIEFTGAILQAGQHLLALINEILDLAKIESGTLSVSLEPVALAEVLAECHSMMAPQAEQRNVRLVFPDKVPQHVYVDRIRLKQILLNLLSNAIKYNRPQGSVLVSCGATVEGPVRISVQDTGSGLQPAQISELFQPFQRLGQEGGAEEGTGIGLVVTKRLAELMGGSIAVTSTPGIGSVFTVMLPPAEAPEPVPGYPAAPPPNRTPGGRPCVLYVEDNPANLKLVEHILRLHADVDLLTATSGPEGLDKALQQLPDVILLDMNLPGLSGREVLRRLRAAPDLQKTPVIALSANAMPDDITNALAEGFFRYVTKPVRVETLTAALEQALHARQTA
nr:PAS domain S-box protein [Massilia sp. TS11]